MNPEYFHNADINLVKAYDHAIVKKAFDYIVQSSIEFQYPQGGCQQRAHIMSLILEKKFQIHHCKVWLFAPAALNQNDYRALFIEDPNNLAESNRIEWNYHVMPVVRAIINNEVYVMVIDPSLNMPEPIMLNEWFTLIGNSNISKYSFLLPDKYFFNTLYNGNEQTNVFDGSFIDFNTCDKDDLTMEKGLSLNDVAIRMYHKHMLPLLSANSDDKKLAELKAIFGNATALDLLLSQNISGNSDNTTHRYVMTNYAEILNEARVLFYERLVYWTNFTNELMR